MISQKNGGRIKKLKRAIMISLYFITIGRMLMITEQAPLVGTWRTVTGYISWLIVLTYLALEEAFSKDERGSKK